MNGKIQTKSRMLFFFLYHIPKLIFERCEDKELGSVHGLGVIFFLYLRFIETLSTPRKLQLQNDHFKLWLFYFTIYDIVFLSYIVTFFSEHTKVLISLVVAN